MEGRDLSPAQPENKTLVRRLALGLATLALVLATSQLRCATPEGFFEDEDGGVVDSDGGKTDADGGEEGPCFTGTPVDETQLLTKCTSAVHEERPQHVPPATWEPGKPLPYSP